MLGRTPLHYASSSGSTTLVKMLIAKGFDVNIMDCDGIPSIMYCVIQVSGNTPLHDAAAGGHVEVFNALISAGANVNTSNEDGIASIS